MSLSSASILKDGTIGVTGGTAKAFTRIGGDLNVAKCVFDGTNYLDRTEAIFTRKEPQPVGSSPDGYSKVRRYVYLKVPKVLASGETVYDYVKVEFARSVETTAAETTTLLITASQLFSDSDFADFWESGANA